MKQLPINTKIIQSGNVIENIITNFKTKSFNYLKEVKNVIQNAELQDLEIKEQTLSEVNNFETQYISIVQTTINVYSVQEQVIDLISELDNETALTRQVLEQFFSVLTEYIDQNLIPEIKALRDSYLELYSSFVLNFHINKDVIDIIQLIELKENFQDLEKVISYNNYDQIILNIDQIIEDQQGTVKHILNDEFSEEIRIFDFENGSITNFKRLNEFERTNLLNSLSFEDKIKFAHRLKVYAKTAKKKFQNVEEVESLMISLGLEEVGSTNHVGFGYKVKNINDSNQVDFEVKIEIHSVASARSGKLSYRRKVDDLLKELPKYKESYSMEKQIPQEQVEFVQTKIDDSLNKLIEFLLNL